MQEMSWWNFESAKRNMPVHTCASAHSHARMCRCRNAVLVGIQISATLHKLDGYVKFLTATFILDLAQSCSVKVTDMFLVPSFVTFACLTGATELS